MCIYFYVVSIMYVKLLITHHHRTELKKVVPTKQIVQDSMARIFTMRRQDITAGNMSVMDTLTKYPAFRFPAQVLSSILLLQLSDSRYVQFRS